MDTLWLDLRLAARRLLLRPGFAAAVILLVGLGVGGGSAVFTLVQGLLLSPPAGLSDPEHLVRLNPATPDGIGASTYPDYSHYRDHARAFRELFGYDFNTTTVQLRATATLMDADARFVTGNFFRGLGVRPAAGRLLDEVDDREQAENAAVLNESLRQRLFPEPANALGRSVTINGHAFTVVGIAPREFRGAAYDEAAAELWLPIWKRPLVTGRPRLDLQRTPDYVHAFMVTMGRLTAGVSHEQAQANIDALGRQLVREFPESRGAEVALTPQFGLAPAAQARILTLVRLIGGLVLIVLFIVCANLANLMLARTVARRREVTIKRALGARPARLVQEFALETLVLALLGGALGLLLAFWGARGLSAFLPFTLSVSPEPDLRVYAFTFSLALLTALACGALPALAATRGSNLQTAARATSAGAAGRTALVVTQVALSFVLLSGAAMFVRTLMRVHNVQLGFQPRGVLAIGFDLRAHGYNEETAPGMFDRLSQRLAQLPGVQAVALGSVVPLSGGRRVSSITIEGRPVNPANPLRIDNNVVSPGYFRTLQTALQRGREFTTADRAGTPRVVIINEQMARTYWPDQNPIGKRIGRGDQWYEVIGVVADTRLIDVVEPARPMFYRAFAQSYFPRMQIYVRTQGDAAELAPAARRAIAEVDPDLAPRGVDALDRVYANRIRVFTTNARLVAVLGSLALVLAAMGLYAVTAYLVAQRTREIGLRMALGAQPRAVLGTVLGGALRRALLGLLIGALAALAVVPALEHFLFELSPLDPVTFLVAGTLLGAATLAASAIPARRATRIDPRVALQAD
ncbi:MAG TPA: ABC transporter permease [Longimicrobiales bacterium]|nr:ABC transporter permease [Longimicrobiales bacterium]